MLSDRPWPAPGCRASWLARQVLPVLIGVAALSTGTAHGQEKRVLRVVPHSDLRTLDPVATASAITRLHGTMVYETLFAWDSHLRPQPLMVDRFSLSPDGLIWTFHLRDGLRFHDGQAVTVEDVIPSLTRWMAHDTLGERLRAHLAALEATDARTLVLRLNRPLDALPFMLGSAVGQMPAIMRARDAATDPLRPVAGAIGSGPFRFNAALWQPGARVVYDRNPDYIPRAEPPDGMAGGHVVKLDRVEWQIQPDPSTAVAALQAGEVDLLEYAPTDLIPVLEQLPDVSVESFSPYPDQILLRPNQLYPPFNDARARQALALLTDQADFLAAGYGDERSWQRCDAYFLCGGPDGTEAGTERFARPDIAQARRLLADAGYRGETVVLIASPDIPPFARMAEVAADALRRAGVTVDLQFSAWPMVVTRMLRRDPPPSGGWNLFITSLSGAAVQSPLTNIATSTACADAWSGWPCDAEAGRRLDAVLAAGTGEERRAAVEALHQRLAEVQPYRLLGQQMPRYARRANVSPLLQAPVMLFWNLEKGR